jgi:hypothetical protein
MPALIRSYLFHAEAAAVMIEEQKADAVLIIYPPFGDNGVYDLLCSIHIWVLISCTGAGCSN